MGLLRLYNGERNDTRGVSNMRASVLRSRRSASSSCAGARTAMRHKFLMHMIIETRNDRDAAEIAKKLKEILEGSMGRMAIESQGIRLARVDGKPDGQPLVYAPKREP